MSDKPEPLFTRGTAVAAAFAVFGAAVIAFGFVPYLSPDTDPVWVFGGAFAFLLIVMLAGQVAKSR
jgi:hypothetical protein